MESVHLKIAVVCVCVHVCSCVCGCICVHKCLCIHEEARGQPKLLLWLCPPWFLSCLSLAWSSPDRLGCTGSASCHLPRDGIVLMHQQAQLFTSVLGIKPRSSCSKACPFLTKSPHSPVANLKEGIQTWNCRGVHQ